VTSDGGDTVNHNHRHFANGEIKTIYGGDEGLTMPPPIDGLGHICGVATRAVGFRQNRHEGKGDKPFRNGEADLRRANRKALPDRPAEVPPPE
jgi:hypothetical protein